MTFSGLPDKTGQEKWPFSSPSENVISRVSMCRVLKIFCGSLRMWKKASVNCLGRTSLLIFGWT